MEQDVAVKIPRTWIKGLPEEELTLKKIIWLGISNGGRAVLSEMGSSLLLTHVR